MIVNYDSGNKKWSTFLDNFKASNSSLSNDFTDALSRINSIAQEDKPKSWLSWGKSFKYADEQLLTFLGDVDKCKRKITDLGSYMDELQQPMSRFQSFTKSAGDALKQLGSMAINTLASFAINEAISLAIQGIDYLIHKDEIAIEKGEEAQNAITEAFETYEEKVNSVSDLGKKYASDTKEIETTSDAVNTLAERYAKLKEGVNRADNSNLSLSSSEYQEYLDISNQLANTFPSLKTGADSAGNSILSIGTNAAVSAAKMERLLETEMALAHSNILEGADDSFKGYYTQVKEVQKEIDAAQEKSGALTNNTISREEIIKGLKAGSLTLKGEQGKLTNILDAYDITSDLGNVGSATYKFTPIFDSKKLSDTATEIEALFKSTNDSINVELGENNALIAAKREEQKQIWSSFAEETVKPYLATTTALMDVPAELTNAVQANLQNIDWSKMYTEYDGDVDSMLLNEFVTPLKTLKPEAQQALVDAFSLDPSQMSIAEYEDAVAEALEKVSNDTDVQNEWKERFGFDNLVSEAKSQAEALKNEFKGIDDEIDSLSGEDRELAYTVAIEDEEFNGTWEDVKNKVEELKALGKDTVTFSYSGFITDVSDAIAKMDALNAALASSVSGKGIGFSYEVDEETGVATLTGELADLMDAYSDLEGYDPSTLFTRTANGIQLNKKALRALQAQEEAENKKAWGDKRKALLEDITDATNKLKEAQSSGDESAIAASQATVDSLNNQLKTVDLLASAYDGATSAYQKWLNAQSNGETGDMYRTASSTMKERGEELWKEGRYNTEEFRAIAQYFSNEDLSMASMEQVVQAYQKTAAARERYFTGDKVGIDNFMYDLFNSTELMTKGVVKELEDGTKQFQAGSDKILADYFGLNVESIQGLLNAAAEYNDGIIVGDTSNTQADLKALEEAANKAKSELKKLQEEGTITTDIDFDVDVSELDEAGIDNRISQLEELRKNAEVKFGADSSEVEYVDSLLQEAIFHKEQLEQETVVNVKYKQIDLTNRPQVSGQKMIDAGWEDVEEDSTATVFTSAYSNEKGDKTVVVTPILPNGDVLSPDSLDGYADKILNGEEIDADIYIREFVGDNSIEQSNLYTEALHRVQDAFYLCDDATKKSLNSLKTYSAEELKAIDLTDDSTDVMEDSFLDLMNSLDLSTEYASQFINVLSDMGLLKTADISVDIKGEEDVEALGKQLASLPEDSSANVTVTISNEDQLDNTVSQLEKVPENTSANFVFNVENQDQADALSAKVAELNKSRGKDNQITYTLNIAQGNDSTPSLKPETSNVIVNYGLGAQEQPKDKDAKVNYKLGDQKDPKSPKEATVNYTLGTVAKPSDITVKVNYELGDVATPVGGTTATGTMLSPARASGTAHNVLNLTPAHANGKVSLSRDENALVNEMGTESLIRDGIWSLIPGGMHVQALKKGDIVLSASQTKSLLSLGRAAGTGKAYANGTIVGARSIASAYSQGSSWAFGNTGGGNLQGTGYSPTASSSNSNQSSNNNTNTSTSQANEEAEEFKETLDWIERKLKAVERDIDNLDKTASAAYKSWSERNTALSSEIAKVNEEISIQQQAYQRYIQQAESVGLSDSYKQLIQAGKIDIETITDEDLKEKIDEYQDWYDKALDCQDAVQDLQDNLADLAKTRFDGVVTQFENLLSVIEHTLDLTETSIDKIETEGYLVSVSMYKAQKELQESQLSTLHEELSSLQSALTTAMAEGNIAKYSEDWYELTGNIQDVEAEIAGLNKDLIETNNLIRETPWNLFDKMQEMLGSVQEESDWLIDLMSDDKMFNTEDASITDKGQATLGLHAVNFNAYMSQADDYAKEIQKINEDIAKDPYNTILLDRRKELIEAQRDLITSAQDEKQAIKDLVSDGYDTFLDVLDKIIDKRAELLESTKDLYDYQKSIESQVKSISELEKQLNAYTGDDSESAKKTVQELKVSLEQAKDDLAESEYDQYISDQQKMLESMRSEIEEWINSRLDNIDGLIQGVIESTNANSESIKTTLEQQASSVGTTLSNSMSEIWSKDGDIASVVTAYGSSFNTALTTTNSVLESIRGYLQAMASASDKKAETEKKNNTSVTTKQDTPKVETPKKDTTPTQPKKEITVGGKINAGSARIYATSSGTGGGSQYYANDPVYTVLSEQNGYVLARYHKLNSGYTGWFKKSDVKAYKDGGLIDYTGFAWVDGTKSKPEAVLNADDTENLVKMTGIISKIGDVDIMKFQSSLDVLPQVQSFTSAKLPKIEPYQVEQVVNIDLGGIEMNGVNDPQEFAEQLRYTLKNDLRTQKIIQADTLGVMLGHNSLTKFKY